MYMKDDNRQTNSNLSHERVTDFKSGKLQNRFKVIKGMKVQPITDRQIVKQIPRNGWVINNRKDANLGIRSWKKCGARSSQNQKLMRRLLERAMKIQRKTEI